MDHLPHFPSRSRKATTGPSTPSNTNPPSLLSKLDRSSILSLDTVELRKALFETPALRTFPILPDSMLEAGLADSTVLIKAAYQLTTSTATLPSSNTLHPSCSLKETSTDDEHWQNDLSDVIGQCMMPTCFSGLHGHDSATVNETAALLLSYIDAIRRGKIISGALGAVSGKLALMESRGAECRRFNAILTLLASWHTVGYSARTMYRAAPSISSAEDLYDALQTNDPIHISISTVTHAMDRMCRRYTDAGQTSVDPEALDLALPAAMRKQLDLPPKQVRLLAVLDSFLLLLNFLYNQSPGQLPQAELLDRQRYYLSCIVAESESSGLAGLLVGPHVYALSAVATIYCLAACRDLAHSPPHPDSPHSSDPAYKPAILSLQRDFLAILDSLKNQTNYLATPPESNIVNAFPYSDGGDMRLIYLKIFRFIKLNVSAVSTLNALHAPHHTIAGSHKAGVLLDTSYILESLSKFGYLGSLLCIVETDDWDLA